MLEKIRSKKNNYYETIEKSHSQIETRRYYLTTSINWFEGYEPYLFHLSAF